MSGPGQDRTCCPICGSRDFCMASAELGYCPMMDGITDDDDPRDPDEEDGDDPGEECGRWDNGRLGRYCRLAGSEFCDWECPYGD